ncbi:hypothetical protein EYF80_010917 [Liparis tanakae]|uniref:Uncharacterized protein n=1 Tax=Liparis tanakae TaxID=230148 RepID=A0A4Z2ILV7_9TELE|nr:hypothetical protein EYF80_010917 [Liparis tanakae]
MDTDFNACLRITCSQRNTPQRPLRTLCSDSAFLHLDRTSAEARGTRQAGGGRGGVLEDPDHSFVHPRAAICFRRYASVAWVSQGGGGRRPRPPQGVEAQTGALEEVVRQGVAGCRVGEVVFPSVQPCPATPEILGAEKAGDAEAGFAPQPAVTAVASPSTSSHAALEEQLGAGREQGVGARLGLRGEAAFAARWAKLRLLLLAAGPGLRCHVADFVRRFRRAQRLSFNHHLREAKEEFCAGNGAVLFGFVAHFAGVWGEQRSLLPLRICPFVSQQPRAGGALPLPGPLLRQAQGKRGLAFLETSDREGGSLLHHPTTGHAPDAILLQPAQGRAHQAEPQLLQQEGALQLGRGGIRCEVSAGCESGVRR